LLIPFLRKCDYECYMKKLLKNLDNIRAKNTTIYNYLKSFEDKELDEINSLYHKLKFFKYSKDEEKLLKDKIKRKINELKRDFFIQKFKRK